MFGQRHQISFSDGTDQHEALILGGVKEEGPALLVLPDWRGWQTSYAQRRGENLADLFDCPVVVGDLYGQAYRPEAYDGDAALWVGKAREDPLALRARLGAYLDALGAALAWSPGAMSVVGYCLGGMLAFEMGRADLGLASVASVHGIPSSKAPLREAPGQTRFLAIHGASDPIIGMEHLSAFQEEMTAAGADWMSLALGHARHGFTDEAADPNGAYQRHDPQAAHRSQGALGLFLLSGGRYDR